MERIDGRPNDTSHRPNGGMLVRKTTRFAGLEIGKTNEAALAIMAQANKYGSGATLALRIAAKNRRSENNGGCVIGHEDRDQRAHAVDQGKKAGGGAVRSFERCGGKPVEDTVFAG